MTLSKNVNELLWQIKDLIFDFSSDKNMFSEALSLFSLLFKEDISIEIKIMEVLRYQIAINLYQVNICS